MHYNNGKIIKLVIAGNYEIELINFLKENVTKIYKMDCQEEFRNMDLEFAFVKERNQYLVNIIMKYLSFLNIEGFKVNLLIDKDIFTLNYNFIFGNAQLNGKYSIVSTARLYSPNKNLFYERCLKEVIHEIGHSFGLVHCKDSSCVMYFSNSIIDTDRKSYNLCEICRKKYDKIL